MVLTVPLQVAVLSTALLHVKILVFDPFVILTEESLWDVDPEGGISLGKLFLVMMVVAGFSQLESYTDLSKQT